MMIKIYALRLRGDIEVRYIGQSADTERRLARHFTTARRMAWATDFAAWLLENKPDIEIVTLAYAHTREEARRVERATVGMFEALDHRLFNQWLVHPKRRCNPRSKPYDPRWQKAA